MSLPLAFWSVFFNRRNEVAARTEGGHERECISDMTAIIGVLNMVTENYCIRARNLFIWHLSRHYYMVSAFVHYVISSI